MEHKVFNVHDLWGRGKREGGEGRKREVLSQAIQDDLWLEAPEG